MTIATISSNLAQSQPMATTPTQILGSPMGSPSAPPCSMVICLMDERKFPSALSLDHPQYIFFRKLGDLRMMLVAYKSDPVNGPSKLRWKEIGKRIREVCYDKNLSLMRMEILKMEICNFSKKLYLVSLDSMEMICKSKFMELT